MNLPLRSLWLGSAALGLFLSMASSSVAGEPIPGVDIKLGGNPPPPPHKPKLVTTNKEGTATFRSLVPAKYIITAVVPLPDATSPQVRVILKLDTGKKISTKFFPVKVSGGANSPMTYSATVEIKFSLPKNSKTPRQKLVAIFDRWGNP